MNSNIFREDLNRLTTIMEGKKSKGDGRDAIVAKLKEMGYREKNGKFYGGVDNGLHYVEVKPDGSWEMEYRKGAGRDQYGSFPNYHGNTVASLEKLDVLWLGDD